MGQPNGTEYVAQFVSCGAREEERVREETRKRVGEEGHAS
jgi:hypothetical protein